ncbi:hypothetical protein DFJ58DRAFT_716980 [Suillus subalutaceus]|uniref:uncharacterized protein n=1 Tax=Suillus subalutaceus TaxID=48586 RepID=UPI001B86049C|nr:uncharacterized protein DFJ58DRAFT_716980 [Suillus subalutaceus]KAG1849178.1 hypothetical protein DFJ58DRAFT_716980 [Suillus subalutaceus]
MSLQPFIFLYRYAVEPIAPFSWFGAKVCSPDLVAVFRLCIALRQMREILHAKHCQRTVGENRLALGDVGAAHTDRSLCAGSLLGIMPSFMFSGVSPRLYIAAQAIVEYITVLPSMSLSTELPLSIVDGFTHAMLLCCLIPPPVVTQCPHIPCHCIFPMVITNGGFFITNIVISTALGGGKVSPMDPESARALCAPILAVLFSTRTAKNFGLIWKKSVAEKIKTG